MMKTMKMKTLLLAGIALCAFGLATPLEASTFTVHSYSVALHNADPGLVIYANPIMVDDYAFSLTTVGQTQTAALFQIGTTESSVDLDDLVPFPISVAFAFSAPLPAFGGNVTGVSSGFILPLTSCGLLQGGCGQVTWGSPLVLGFGGSGQLSVSLQNRTFATPGTATVNATFTLVRQDTGLDQTATVPEPSSMLLLGSGVAAFIAQRRFRAKKA